MREPVERLGGLIDQRHAAGLPGLGRVLLPSPDRTAHVEEPIDEVDVPPAQGPELALSEPREGRHRRLSPADAAQRATAWTSDGDRTANSVRCLSDTRSASSAGLSASQRLRFAYLSIPYRRTNVFCAVRRDTRSRSAKRKSSMSSRSIAVSGLSLSKYGTIELFIVFR